MQAKLKLLFIIIFLTHFLNLSHSQSKRAPKFIIGLSSQAEHFYENEYVHPYTSSIGLFGQIRFSKKLSANFSYLISQKYHTIQSNDIPYPNGIIFFRQEMLMKEKLLNLNGSLIYYFWENNPKYFIQLGYVIKNPIELKIRGITSYRGINSVKTKVFTIKDKFKKDELNFLKGYSVAIGAEYNLYKRIFFSWRAGVYLLNNHAEKNFANLPIYTHDEINTSQFKSNSIFLRFNFGYSLN